MRFSVRWLDVCPGKEKCILRKSAFWEVGVTEKCILRVTPHGKAQSAQPMGYGMYFSVRWLSGSRV